MGKLKTIQAVAKRFRITKVNKKVMKKKAGQDHYNARERGKVTRQKRKLTGTSVKNSKNIKKFIPYY